MKALVIGFLCACICCCGPASTKPQEATRKVQLTDEQCDSPDADINCAFVYMPVTLTSVMAITSPDEPGQKITITGTVFKKDGITPFPDVIMYAYHTDNHGYYSKKGDEKGALKWHGRLHGWCKTSKDGNYTIKTIRPSPYPNGNIPAHIHATVRTSLGTTQWINDFVFKDDPLVNENYISKLSNHSGTGIITLTKAAENSWTGKRDIILNMD